MIRKAPCLLFGLLLLAGCGREQPKGAAPKPPEVLVSAPLTREVIDYEFFTGRTIASQRVELRSRVTGYLEKALFKEGDLVKKDDVLLIIDPRTYQSEVVKAEASVAQSQATARRVEGDFERAQGLLTKGAIGREEYEKLRGNRDEAKAAVRVAEANLRLAQDYLTFTEIKAPFSGRVSRRNVDPGNLVKADETVLTTLVAEEPIWANFDVDERTLLRQLMKAGKLESSMSDRVPVTIGLADEEGFPHTGVVNFVDNEVDRGTGSMWMRAEFINPKRSIKPGMFIRVRFPLGRPRESLLIAEQALGTDQGQKFVFVVGPDNKVEYRAVKVGRLQEDGLRVIRDGLKPGERVVVSGLQRVRAGTVLTPKYIEMPTRAAKPAQSEVGAE